MWMGKNIPAVKVRNTNYYWKDQNLVSLCPGASSWFQKLELIDMFFQSKTVNDGLTSVKTMSCTQFGVNFFFVVHCLGLIYVDKRIYIYKYIELVFCNRSTKERPQLYKSNLYAGRTRLEPCRSQWQYKILTGLLWPRQHIIPQKVVQ